MGTDRSPHSPIVAPRSHVSPTTVFIAEDDDVFRGLLRGILEEDGYEVLEASNGEDALLFLASAADGERPMPDVLIVDVNMPGFSGLGILRVVHRFERPPPSIVVTGFTDPSVELFARRFGALRVLHKPLDLDELRASVLDAAMRGAAAAPAGHVP